MTDTRPRYVEDVKLWPVDRVARRVTSGGINYDPAIKGDQIWDTPPPLVEVGPAALAHPEWVDLRGTRRGRLQIIGYLGKNHSSKTSQWLARCDCGLYTRRNSKSWRAGLRAGTTDMCERCNHVNQLRVREEEYRHGKNPGYRSAPPRNAAVPAPLAGDTE